VAGTWRLDLDRNGLLQNKYRLEDAQTEPMISIANDNWAEYNFVMWLDIKTKNHKIRIVYKNINWDWNYKWSRKDGLSDIPLVQAPDFNINVKNNNRSFSPFSLII
jgi:hypothetical protein